MEPFGGIAGDGSARFALIPVPYEKTTTYRKGTAEGPAALLKASTQVETFDEETRVDPWEKCGIETLEPTLCAATPDVLATVLEE